MGLLGDIYSYGDGLKRKLKGLLADPAGTLDMGLRRLREDQQSLQNLFANAYPMAGDKTVMNSPQQIAQFRREAANAAANLGLGMAGVINWPKSPKTLYHGSADDFDKFDRSLLGTNTRAKDAEVGFHFSDNKADASLYADMAARNKLMRDEPWSSKSDVSMASGIVRPFDINMKNPLVVALNESDGNTGKNTQQFLDDKWAAKIYADEHGYDGIIYPNGTNVDAGYTAIAFDPSQITKMATQTNRRR